MDVWMITCMVYVFAALLEFALVYHVHTISKKTNPNLMTPSNSVNQVSNYILNRFCFKAPLVIKRSPNLSELI